MSIEVVAPLIQTVNRAIIGTTWAPNPAEYPGRDLTSGDVPVALVYEGEGTTKGKKHLKYAERNYIIEVWFAPRTQGDYGQMKLDTSKLLDDYIETWMARINDDEDHILDYGSTSGYRVEMDLGKPIMDSGVREDLEWMPEQFYFGFHIILPILVRWGSGL